MIHAAELPHIIFWECRHDTKSRKKTFTFIYYIINIMYQYYFIDISNIPAFGYQKIAKLNAMPYTSFHSNDNTLQHSEFFALVNEFYSTSI